MSCVNCDHCQHDTWAFASGIVDFVCVELGISRREMLSPIRTGRIVMPRRIAEYLVRELTTLPFEAIGSLFEKDYSTVIVGTQEIARRMAAAPAFAMRIEEMRAKLRGEKVAA